MTDLWEPVIGLEMHARFKTKSKLFSPAPNHFGDEPNTNISFVCTGQPGTLPILNAAVVRQAVQFGCAVQADIALISRFDRKSYFYPDSPRNFQITQFDFPILKKGKVELPVRGKMKTFFIHHAHIEDDSGILRHFTGFSGVDDNRAGVPLLEIVSEPCMHSAEDAVAYASAIRGILLALDVSDCNMEEGSLRMDCNISVRKKGETSLRNKIEIKNMNSFYNMQLAIEAEVKRQIAFYESEPKGILLRGTYRFDLEKNETVLMRLKETSEDYRYFPEPDLPPVVLTEAYIDEIRNSLPELPQAKWQRYTENLQIAEDFATLLVADKALSTFFEEALKKCENARLLCTWVVVEFVGRLKEKGIHLTQSGISPIHVGELVAFIEKGSITGKIAKAIADQMVLSPAKSPADILKENPDYQPIEDSQLLETLVEEVLKENPQSVADFSSGIQKALAHLVGQVMKKSRGAAHPTLVNAILLKKLKPQS